MLRIFQTKRPAIFDPTEVKIGQEEAMQITDPKINQKGRSQYEESRYFQSKVTDVLKYIFSCDYI
jgi:hypothetical protein